METGPNGDASSRAAASRLVADKLDGLVHNAKASDHDRTISDIAGIIRTVGHLSSLARRQLDENAEPQEGAPVSTEGRRLWRCIDAQLNECDRAVDAVGDFIDRSNKAAPDSNGTPSTSLTRLSASYEELHEFRTSMRVRSAGLQMTLIAMSLVIVQIRGTQLAPHTLRQELLVRMNSLQKVVDERSTPPELHALMDNAMSICASLYTGSAPDRPLTSSSSTHGQVTNWIKELENLRVSTLTPQTKSCESQVPSSLFSVSAEDKETISTDIAPSSGSLAMFDSADLSDEEGEGFALETVTQALDAGREAFDRNDFNEANSMLQEALRIAQNLPPRQRTLCDTYDMQYRLAVCACYIQPPEVAETALLSFTKLIPSKDVHRRQLCDIGHLLAQTYVRLNKLDMARPTCESALKGRRMLLGKQNHAYYDSLALLARICELQDRLPEAKVYVRMIPIELQKSLCSRYNGLGTPPSSPPRIHMGSPSFSESTREWQSVSGQPSSRAGPYPQYPAELSAAPQSPIVQSPSGQLSAMLTPPMQSPPMHSAPMHSPPMHSPPIHSPPMHSPPMHSPPMTPPTLVHPAFRAPDQNFYRPESPASSVHSSVHSMPFLGPVPPMSPPPSQHRPEVRHANTSSPPFYHQPDRPQYHARTSSFSSQHHSIQEQSTPTPQPAAVHYSPFAPTLYQSPPVQPDTPQPRPLDLESRQRWLDKLDIWFAGDPMTFAPSNDKNSQKRRGGPTAIHLAALFGEVIRFSELVRSGKTISTVCKVPVDRARSVDNVHPIHFAIGARQDEMIRRLASQGVSLNGEKGSKNPAPPAYLLWNSWLIATDYSEPKEVLRTLQLMLSLGWNINEQVYHTGWTMLHYAAFLPQDKVPLRDAVVRYLLGAGADARAVSVNGWTPLHVASNSNCTAELVQLLLAKDHSLIHHTDKAGDTPLHGAARLHATKQNKVSIDIIYSLCCAGANVLAKNKDNRTPLSLAEFYKDEDAVTMMRRFNQGGAAEDVESVRSGSTSSTSRRFSNFTGKVSRVKS